MHVLDLIIVVLAIHRVQQRGVVAAWSDSAARRRGAVATQRRGVLVTFVKANGGNGGQQENGTASSAALRTRSRERLGRGRNRGPGLNDANSWKKNFAQMTPINGRREYIYDSYNLNARFVFHH